MLSVKIICVGSLKENYLREASAEYSKRLSGFCKFNVVELKETRLSEAPSQKEIESALRSEGQAIISAMPQRSYKIAMCVEGKQMSSEKLAAKLEDVSQTYSEICLVIGSSFGLSEDVKKACDMRLSVSELTFPHQLLRILLLEAIYRAFNINAGTRYHK